MSAVNARAGLIARLHTIDGLTVITHEPFSVVARPAVIVTLIGGRFQPGGQVRDKLWRFAVRVVVALQDAALAEDELVPFADSITAALLADRSLGNMVSIVPGWEISSEGPDGYYTVNEVTYRSLVFRFDVTDKLP